MTALLEDSKTQKKRKKKKPKQTSKKKETNHKLATLNNVQASIPSCVLVPTDMFF